MAEKKKDPAITAENKTEQIRIWFSESDVREMDEIYSEVGCPDRSHFIREAIKFYIGYIRQNKNIDYLSPVLGSVIKSEVDGAVRNISEMLFKMAVQESLLTNVLAAHDGITREALMNVQRWCEQDVARSNGIMSFEKAYSVQNDED